MPSKELKMNARDKRNGVCAGEEKGGWGKSISSLKPYFIFNVARNIQQLYIFKQKKPFTFSFLQH